MKFAIYIIKKTYFCNHLLTIYRIFCMKNQIVKGFDPLYGSVKSDIWNIFNKSKERYSVVERDDASLKDFAHIYSSKTPDLNAEATTKRRWQFLDRCKFKRTIAGMFASTSLFFGAASFSACGNDAQPPAPVYSHQYIKDLIGEWRWAAYYPWDMEASEPYPAADYKMVINFMDEVRELTTDDSIYVRYKVIIEDNEVWIDSIASVDRNHLYQDRFDSGNVFIRIKLPFHIATGYLFEFRGWTEGINIKKKDYISAYIFSWTEPGKNPKYYKVFFERISRRVED